MDDVDLDANPNVMLEDDVQLQVTLTAGGERHRERQQQQRAEGEASTSTVLCDPLYQFLKQWVRGGDLLEGSGLSTETDAMKQRIAKYDALLTEALDTEDDSD